MTKAGERLIEAAQEAVTMAKLICDNDTAQSRIADLEAEVAEARERLRLAVKSADLSDAAIDTAWNDAIEAAALAANDYEHYELEEVIRSLRR